MKKLTLIFALMCSISAFSVNIVNNGTFEHATNNYAWLNAVTAPGTQTIGVETTSPITGSKSAKFTVGVTGGSAANITSYVGIACAKGATYKISFKAKATNAANMTVKVTNLTATGTAVTTQTASLTSTVQSFEFTFANANLCSYNFLVFQYGNFATGTVITLDDVAVEEVTSPLTNGNLCNGDFEANVTLGKSAGSLTGYASFMDANISWTQLKLTGGTMNMYTSATNPISGLKSFVCNVGATPGATNAAQMVGWSFAAVVGKKYTCSFKAKIATGTFNAGIKLISYNGSITNFDNITGVALTTTPQTFTFTSNAISDYSAYYILCLQIGTATANTNITIDDVELYVADLETPTVVTASSISSSGFTASWNAIPRAVSYDVYVYQGASLVSGSPFNASGQATTSLAISDLSPNTSYTYKVIAKGNATSTFDSPASTASASFTTNKADQSITLPATGSKTYGDADYSPATSATSGIIPITYQSSAPSVATIVSNKIHIVGVGQTSITASQTGNTSYNAAIDATQTLTINPATLTITAGNQSVTYGTLATTVTSAGTYTPSGFITGEDATVIGGSATYSTTYTNSTAVGTSATITPIVTGLTATNYSFTPATGTITITQATPTLSLASSSVSYTGSAQAATVNGSVAGSASNVLYNGSATVPSAVGSYPITADFAPTDGTNYASLIAASAGTFIINATVPGAPTSVVGTAGNTEVSVAFTAPANNGGSAITGYTVTPYDGATAGTPVTQNANPITVTGLTNGTAYTFKVTANNSVGSSLVSDASGVVTPIAPNVSVAYNETKTPLDLGLTPASVVTVDNGGTLKIDATTTVNSVTVGNSGKLIVEASKPLTVGTLTLTGALDGTTTSVKLDANINATTVRLLKTIDNTKWYFMSFPYNVVVADITKSNGSPKPTLNLGLGDLFIKYYDGGQRGTNGTVTSNWKHYEGAELIANQGYIFGLSNTQPEMTLSFPLKIAGGILTAETSNRSISVAENYGTQANDRGWNLIGQPFLSKFIASNAVGAYDIYAYNGVDYTPFTKANIPDINPFSAYFIQASAALAGTGISFVSATGRQLSPSVAASELLDEVQLDFTSSTGSDYALLRMDNSLTTGYDIGSDFEKWIGTETPKPQIYTSLGGINYAFNALPMTNVVNLPVGIYTKTAGITTIHAAAAKAPSLSKLLLTDNSTNPATVTDLLISDYTFTAAAGTDNSRFVITAQRVPTENVVETGANEPTLVINNSKLIINNVDGKASIRVFDAIGRMITNKTVSNNSLEINLSAKGMYTVQIEFGGKNWVKKIVN